VVDGRLRKLLGDEQGQIRPELAALHRSLASADYPDTVLRWLDRPTGPAIVRELAIGARPLSHAALDELSDSKPLEHLRAMLVATGALPARDEQLARLERWITRTIGDRDDPAQQQLLHRYAVWHLLRRLRHRNGGADTTHSQLATVRQQLRAAIVLLDWLAAHDLTLQTAGQGDLEIWLAGEQATHRLEAGHFVRWARNQKLTSLDFPATRWGGPTGIIDTGTRWQQARWLLHDDTLDPEDRVAGLLVLLYAQWPSAVSRLTLDHVHADDTQVRLRLGREPLVLPEPLAGLVLQLVATRRGHATLGVQGASRWLLPGGQPGRPLSAEQLGERLRRLGLRPGQARSTALFQLATELPAAILARLLGIHIAVAVAWQRASSGDWAAYAADVSRRTNPGGHVMHRDDQPTHNPTVISPERTAEIEETIDRVRRWAVDRRDIVGLLLVGSCARNAARPDSDIDLVLLTNDAVQYSGTTWANELALGRLIRTQSWGPITERRFVTASGLEVEINIGSADWANTNPVDPGTHRVVTDGVRPLHDPTGVLASLLHACRP